MSLETRIAELKRDLCLPDGPAISTNRNYPFAILHYDPSEEFRARELTAVLVDELRLAGWNIRNIDLFALFLDYLRAQEDGELLDSLVAEERLQYERAKDDYRAPLASLKNTLAPYFSRKDGYPGRVLAEIQAMARAADPLRSVIFLSRIGGLYPFYRTSALLRFLDEGVRVPTVVLYPGTRVEQHYLSFMGTVIPDRDYRPRIY
jgi:hypothetical protein